MPTWKTKAPNEVYGAAEIEQRLHAELPRWTHASGALHRRYATSGWKSTLMVVNTVGHLAEAAWHHPEMSVAFDAVTVTLSNHEARGVTEKDFALARKIEDVVLWRPGVEAGAVLEGTPDDPRWQYIRYD